MAAWRSILSSAGFLFLVLLSSTACGKSGQQAAASQQQAEGWKVIGPGGGGGLFEPTIDPFDPRHVLMRCDMTGAYVTFDGGENWRMFDLWTVVTDFEFDPSARNTVYASSRGYLHDPDRGSGLSLLCRSEDGGLSWSVVWPDVSKAAVQERLQNSSLRPSEIVLGTPDGTIEKVRVDPADSRRIYLGLTPLLPYIGRARPAKEEPSRLLLSTDRGASWRVLAELPDRRILAILPGSLDERPGEVTVFTERAAYRIKESSGEMSPLSLPESYFLKAEAGKGDDGPVIYLLSPLKRTAGGAAGGIYRSADRGASWVPANEGLLLDVPAGESPSLRTLAVCATRPEVAYLSVVSRMNNAEGKVEPRDMVFKTGNSGQSWHPVYAANSDSVLTGNFAGSWLEHSYGPGWGGAPIDLGVAPTDPDVCFAGDYGRAWSTSDGGKTWRELYSHNQPDGSYTSSGLDVTCCYGLHFDPFDSQHYFISYIDTGLFYTLNGGESWFHSIQGISGNWVNTCYWLDFDPTVKDRVWSAWANVHSLPRRSQFAPGRFQRGLGGVAFSEDGGRTWSKSSDGLPEHSVCTHLLLDPDSPPDSRTLYLCVFDQGVYKSTDGGRSWKASFQGLGANRYAWETVPAGRKLFLLCVRGWPDDTTEVDGALYVSEDGAETWRSAPLPEGVTGPLDLLADPQTPERMYLSCWPKTVDNKDIRGGVYRTEDGGQSWRQVFDEQVRVYAAAFDPRNTDVLYINTFQNAAYRSEDRGEHWERLPGYRFKWGHRPVPDPTNPDRLFLTTYGGSVFYGPATGTSVESENLKNLPAAWR